MQIDPQINAHKSRKGDETASVAILMGTCNGAKFIGEQLQSFADQTHSNWSLFASDDGSADDTEEIIKRFGQSHEQRTTFRRGPGKGVSVNFLTLATDPTIEADYFAFSDQDDIWYRNKLSRSLRWISTVPADVPALYCARTELMTADGRSFGYSPIHSRPPSFRNALVQSLGGGNTMLFNRATKKLLRAAGIQGPAFYDWWMYQLVTAAGGVVRYDPEPVLKYRQHSNNLVGSNRGWNARLLRLRMMLDGEFSRWNDTNIAALQSVPDDLITAQNRDVLRAFAKVRNASLPRRILYLFGSGVYRQTWLDNVGLFLAIGLKKI